MSLFERRGENINIEEGPEKDKGRYRHTNCKRGTRAGIIIVGADCVG